MKKLSLAVLIALGTMVSSSAVQANEIGVSGNIGGTSNYIWRGMTQTQNKGAVSAEVDLAYNGFYLGAWASNVDFGNDADYELDVYAGYGNSIGDFSYDINYLKFLYPSSKDAAEFDEITVGIGYDIAKLSLGASYSFGVYTENDGVKNDYAEATASYDLEVASLDLSYGDYENTGENYTVGFSKSLDFKGNSLDLAITYANYDSDAGEASDEEEVFASVTYSF